MPDKQSHYIKRNVPIHHLHILFPEHTPHWRLPGADTHATATLHVTTHDKAKWVSLDTQEYGDRSNKRTMITLDETSGRALYDRLKELYE